jgi:hypothetical protein
MDKYPASFTWLPAEYEQAPSDNACICAMGEEIYGGEFIKLSPSASALGVNKKSLKISTTIAFGEFYVLWAVGTSLYKIGISTNFLRRFKDLSAASPLPLKTVRYAKCDSPHLLESHLHEMFKHRLFKNEWFSLDQEHIDAMESVLSRYFERTDSVAA